MKITNIMFLVASSFLATTSFADDGTGNETCENQVIEYCVTDPDNIGDLLLPDLMTVVPKHLTIQNKQKQEILRFSNGIANLGKGPWWLEPESPSTGGTDPNCQNAFQLIPNASQFPNRSLTITDEQIPAPPSAYSARCQKGNFDYHETHNHWHIDNVGEFKICREQDFDENDPSSCTPATTSLGAVVGIKFTFCLIDWYKLGSNTANSDITRNFFACETGFQGISPGWVDQYHHATPGQDIDITGLPEDDYVLVSTVNARNGVTNKPVFDEGNVNNNTAYVKFHLYRGSNSDSDGNGLDNGNDKLKIAITATSCDNQNYSTMLDQTIENFVTYYPDEIPNKDDIKDHMCGGKSANR